MAKAGLTCEIKITDMDVFQNVISALRYAYENSTPEVKAEIENRLGVEWVEENA